MAPSSKNKRQQQDADEGKESFKQSSEDCDKLFKTMLTPGFFTSWTGPMSFYDHPLNAYYSNKYKRDGFQNGYNHVRKHAMDTMAGINSAAQDASELFLIVLSCLFGRSLCCVESLVH